MDRLWFRIILSALWFVLICSFPVSAEHGPGNERGNRATNTIEVETLCQLFTYYSELLTFDPKRPLINIRNDISQIEITRLKQFGKFNDLKLSLMEVAQIEGTSRPLKAMRLSKQFGGLMKCRQMTYFQMLDAGYPKVAKNMQNLRQHMVARGEWDQVRCQ